MTEPRNRVLVFAAAAAMTFTVPAFAERAFTADGRGVTLHADGTFTWDEGNDVTQAHDLEVTGHHFVKVHERRRDEIHFMPLITNTGDKPVVGIRFTSVFYSSFGDEVFRFSGEIDERLSKGARSTANLYYYFRSNPGIPDQPYDRLLSLAENGTGRMETVITAIAYADGSQFTVAGW